MINIRAIKKSLFWAKLLILSLFLHMAQAAEVTLITPIKLQVVVESAIYAQPNTNSEQMKQLEYGELVDAQTLKSFGRGSLWWQLQLDSGGIGYIPAEHLSNIMNIPEDNQNGLHTPYLMGMTHTVEFILTYDTEQVLINHLYDYLQVPLISEFPTAYWLVGILHRDGIAAPQNTEEAMQYLFKGIQRGEIRGYFDLAKIFFEGIGVEKDEDEAIRFARLGAEKGDPRAKDWLANLDITMIQDRTHPIQSQLDELNMRIENGDTEAMRLLAAYLLSAQSVAYDDIRAEGLLSQAANQGDVDAMLGLSSLYLTGSKNILPQANASNFWNLQAALQGNAKAQYLYGNALYYGLGTATNKEEGLSWLQKSAAQNYQQAISSLQQIAEQEARTSPPS